MIAMPDPTTFATFVLLVIALATPYLLVRYLVHHRNAQR
jgi:hypothetical protein